MFLSFFLMIISYSYRDTVASCEIKVFDCGQGNAVVARYKGQSMVFDAGRTAYAEFYKYDDDRSGDSEIGKKYCISEGSSSSGGGDSSPLYLEVDLERFSLPGAPKNTAAHKCIFKDEFEKFVGDNLEAVFISHPDCDHYSLVEEFKLKPKKFILGGYWEFYRKAFQEYVKGLLMKKKSTLSLAESFSGAGEPDYLLGNSSSEDSSSLPQVKVLVNNAVGEGKEKDKNADSMVVRLSHKDCSILITGDAEGSTWSKIQDLDLNLDLKSDIFIVPHHGSNTKSSTTKEIVNLIQPKVCLISAGFQHAHPSQVIIDLLLNYYEGQAYRTTPHFITFFDEGNKRKTYITTAPIFSTIDNGVLSIKLEESLTVQVSRAFWPSLGTYIQEEEESWKSLHLLSVVPEKLILSSEISGFPLLDIKYFGADIREESLTSSEYRYWYEFGDVALPMKLVEINSKDKTRTWEKGVKKWIELRKSEEIYLYILRFTETLIEIEESSSSTD